MRAPGVQLLPRRWVVKRTFAWIGRNRRMSKVYAFVLAYGEAWMYLNMTRLMYKRLARERPQPSTAIVDSRTLRSTVASGARAGVDGNQRVRGSKVHAVVDTMGTLLALAVTPANETERRQISALAQRVQEVTGEQVEVLYADAASTGAETAAAAQEQGMQLVVVQRPEGSQGFVLLPKRWVVERSFA